MDRVIRSDRIKKGPLGPSAAFFWLILVLWLKSEIDHNIFCPYFFWPSDFRPTVIKSFKRYNFIKILEIVC